MIVIRGNGYPGRRFDKLWTACAHVLHSLLVDLLIIGHCVLVVSLLSVSFHHVIHFHHHVDSHYDVVQRAHYAFHFHIVQALAGLFRTLFPNTPLPY